MQAVVHPPIHAVKIEHMYAWCIIVFFQPEVIARNSIQYNISMVEGTQFNSIKMKKERSLGQVVQLKEVSKGI